MILNRLGQSAAITALVLLIVPAHAPAVHAAQAPQDRIAQVPAPAEGELMRVNPEAKTLSLKVANGAEQTFRYTDSTTVSGAEKSVAGLATMSGAQLTISYRVEGSERVATAIVVRNKT